MLQRLHTPLLRLVCDTHRLPVPASIASAVQLDSWTLLDFWRGLSIRDKSSRNQDVRVANEERRAAAGSGRPGNTTSPDVLRRLQAALRPTPPVNFVRGMAAPTAMSWMRRRGPQVPHAVLYRLFRQRQIRLFDGSKVTRVSGSRQLRNGDQLLYPRWLQPPDRAAGQGGGRAAAPAEPHDGTTAAAGADDEDQYDSRMMSHGAAGPGPGSRGPRDVPGGSKLGSGTRRKLSPQGDGSLAAAGAAAAATASAPSAGPLVLTPERVRRWVLGVHPGLVFINKPAGVKVHGRAKGDTAGWRGGGGGGGDVATLDGVLRRALRFGEDDEPRIVHRLDQQASGVMVVARNADSAAWLSAAFRGKAQQALAEADEEGGDDGDSGTSARVGHRRRDGGGGGGEGRAGAASPESQLQVQRTYWAFLAGNLQPRQSGRIRFPVAVEGTFQNAVTQYRVRATGCGITWVELTPETGRRHQLRVHCARKLGVPIIGDARYGYHGLPPRLALRDHLPPEWWALLGEDPRVTRRRAKVAVHDRDHHLGYHEGEGSDSDSDEARVEAAAVSTAATAAGGGLPPPILLHARQLVVKRPGKAALVAVAPLPRYIRELFQAAGWPLPNRG